MKLRATGFRESIPPDYAETRRALSALMADGQTFEIRALPSGRSAICRSADDAIRALRDMPGSAGIYYTLNPCRADLAKAASNGDITSRRWILIDVDPIRTGDSSSTDDEKAEAARVASAVVEDLSARGWPMPLLIDSGNGFHVLYRVDLPNTRSEQDLIRRFLVALAAAHDTDASRVDTAVHNAARIAKLPGTWARKGLDDADRPHRMARLKMCPDGPAAIVGIELIREVADQNEPKSGQQGAPKPNGRMTTPVTGGRAEAWCRAALHGECARVASAVVGDRNNQLNIAAYKIGQILHHGAFSRPEAEQLLSHVGRGAGLGDREVEATVASGLDAGLMEPRELPPAAAGSPQGHRQSRQNGQVPSGGGPVESNSVNSGGSDDGLGVDDPWAKPVLDLQSPATQFPLAALPDPVADFVRAAADCLSCPVDFVACACLGVAAGAIGRSLAIRIKPGWIESAAIYLAEVGEPGMTKSPALAMAARPLWAISRELLADHKEMGGDTPPARIVVDDATVESLAPILGDNPRGIVMIRDELTALFAGLNQYKGGKGADRQFYLSAWSGSSLSVDRKSNQNGRPIFIHRPCLSIVGGVTPGMLSELGEAKGRDDGFLDRILFSTPERVPVRWSAHGMPAEHEVEWDSIVRRLRSVPMMRDDKTGDDRPFIVSFAPDAIIAYGAWFDALSDETDGPDFPPHLRGPWAKLRAYCARLALILDRMDRACDPEPRHDDGAVSAESLSRAIALIGYFKSHIRRARAIMRGARGDNQDAMAILRWLTGTGRLVFSERDARRNFRSRFPSCGHELSDAVRWLVDRHCIRPKVTAEHNGPGRPSSQSYEVNPALFEEYYPDAEPDDMGRDDEPDVGVAESNGNRREPNATDPKPGSDGQPADTDARRLFGVGYWLREFLRSSPKDEATVTIGARLAGHSDADLRNAAETIGVVFTEIGGWTMWSYTEFSDG